MQDTEIYHLDYKETLKKYAKKGDFIFLDPPYQPVGKFSDFKRYTKEFFYENDQIELANIFKDLTNKGCYVMLTNSDHPFILDLYKEFHIETIETKRLISSNPNTRTGIDIIVLGGLIIMQLSFETLEEQFQYFPGTRYMGSKNKIIYDIWQRLDKIEFESVLDAFGGSNVVGYFLKCQGEKSNYK